MVAGGRITVAYKDAREDPEEYWDRAWALAVAASSRGLASAWDASMFAHAKARGAVYSEATDKDFVEKAPGAVSRCGIGS